MFPQNYSFRILDRAPLIQPRRTFVFPKRVEEIERGALYLEVRPQTGEPWLGIFALGYDSAHVLTGAYATPNPDQFLAVSGGYAYLADTLAPERTELLPQQPIVWIGESLSPSLLLIADHHRVTAIGANGIAWQSSSLSMEGLTDLRVDSTLLHGKGWDAITDADTPWTLDLHTGCTI
jgi:hypothetical protein